MSEVLVGVVVGGIIASVGPLSTLVFGYWKWKRECRLEYLRSERARLEVLIEKNLALFAKGAAKNNYSSDMSSDFLVLMPKEVNEVYMAYMLDEEKTIKKHKFAYMDLASTMKRTLAAIDAEIREIVG
jgi:hypothetical protein